MALSSEATTGGADRTAPLETRSGAATSETVATLNGQRIMIGDFRSFVNQVRSPGYRASTPGEATRLLQAYLGERLLDEVVRERGFAPDAAGHSAALATLVREYGQPVHIAEREVDRYLEQHQGNLPTRRDQRTSARQVAQQFLYEQRADVQRRAVLGALLEKAQVHINADVLSQLVCAKPLDAGQRPPQPPGFEQVRGTTQ